MSVASIANDEVGGTWEAQRDRLSTGGSVCQEQMGQPVRAFVELRVGDRRSTVDQLDGDRIRMGGSTLLEAVDVAAVGRNPSRWVAVVHKDGHLDVGEHRKVHDRSVGARVHHRLEKPLQVPADPDHRLGVVARAVVLDASPESVVAVGREHHRE
ncbi:MAG: hypothetical protein V9E94_06180 [Microthrixaceae bacterium]